MTTNTTSTATDKPAPASTGREAQLMQALRDANAVAIRRGDKFGLCDAIDNHGQAYQSQWLADLLAATPVAARELDVEAERREFDAYVAECQTPSITGEDWSPLDIRKAWLVWQARAARSAAQSTAPVSTEQAGDAWQVVPKEMTMDMHVAFAEVWFSKVRPIDDHDMQDAYAAMLEAAPSPNNSPVGADKK